MNPKFWFLFVLLAGAGISEAHPACHNCLYGQGLTARYDRSNCRDIPHTAKWVCDRVEFDPDIIALK